MADLDDYDRAFAQTGLPETQRARWREIAGAPRAPITFAREKLPVFSPENDETKEAALGIRQLDTPTPSITNPYSPATVSSERWTPEAYAENAKAKEAAKRLERFSAWTPESAAKQAGVRIEPGEIGARLPPEMAGQFVGASQAGPAAPQLISPGGRRPASWQVQEGLDLSPEAQKASERASKEEHDAAALEYGAGQRAAEFERGYIDRLDKAAKAHVIEEKERSRRYTDEYDAQLQILDADRKAVREATLDPTAGAGIRVGLGFATAVAAVLGTAIGGPGRLIGQGLGIAFKPINDAIDANIRGQEEQVKKAERGMRVEAAYLGAMKQKYGDIGVAKEAVRIAQLEAAKVELTKQVGDPSVADPRMLAAYKRISAGLDDQLVSREARFKQLTEDRIVRHDVNAPAQYAGVATAADKEGAKHLSDAYEKAGIPESLAALEDVDKKIDTFGEGDIPGVGLFAGKVPMEAYGFFGADRQVAGRQAVQTLKNEIIKKRSGAVVTEGEARRLAIELEGADRKSVV